MNNAYVDFAVKVCEILNISTPKIKAVEALRTATQLGQYVPAEDVLYFRSGAERFDVCFSIAHELRHKWQIENAPEMISQYVTLENADITSYNMQAAELDANAFGAL